MFLTLVIAATLALAEKPPVVVVAREEAVVKALDRESLALLYSGRTLRAGEISRVNLVDYRGDNTISESFYRSVLGVSGRQAHTFWLQYTLSGQGRGPTFVTGPDEMVRMLRRLPEAVGYLWSDEVPADLLTVTRLEPQVPATK